MFPPLSTATSDGFLKLPAPAAAVPKLPWPMTKAAVTPAVGAFCVLGKTKTRLAAVSAAYRLEAWSTASPWGEDSVCGETWVGLIAVRSEEHTSELQSRFGISY